MYAIRGLLSVLARLMIAAIFLMSAVGNKILNFNGVAEGMAQKVNDVVTQRIDPVVIRLDEGLRSAGELMSAGATSVRAVLEGHQDELRAALSSALDRLNDVMDARSNSAMAESQRSPC